VLDVKKKGMCSMCEVVMFIVTEKRLYYLGITFHCIVEPLASLIACCLDNDIALSL